MRPIPKELTRNGHGRMDESLKGCCFTGHRQIPQDLAPKLKQRVKDGIEYLYANMGVTTYYAGGALGFDALAAEAVIEQRKKYPSISLVLVIPCRNQAVRWSAGDKAKYEQLKGDANEVICLAEHYFSGCMHQRNRYMVDHSRACICYLTERTGGTAYTVKYARERGLRIFNLAKPKGGGAQ